MTETPRKRAPRKPAAPQDEGVQEVNTPPPETTAGRAKPPTTTVQAVGDWNLVTHGSWQISVAPDGLMMLPRHLHPDEWDDFVAAGTHAKQVGVDVIAANDGKTAKSARALPRRRAIVNEGPPPEGTVRMNVSQQQAAATIGRPRRGQRPTNPMTAGRAAG